MGYSVIMGYTVLERRRLIGGLLCTLLLLNGCYLSRDICSLDDKTSKPYKLKYEGGPITYKVNIGRGWGSKTLPNETKYFDKGKWIKKEE